MLDKIKESFRLVDDWHEFASEGGECSLGEVELVHSEEGQGWVRSILHVKSLNVYVQVDGDYSSYEGTNWGDIKYIEQVYPHLVTTTEYRKYESVQVERDITEVLKNSKIKAGALFLPQGNYHLSNNILTAVK